MHPSPTNRLLKPLNRFIHQEYAGGIVLCLSVIIAIVWVNAPWAAAYHHLWEMQAYIGFNDKGLHLPFHAWINDGLMALFFFVIGLELKREFIAGELSTLRKASLPLMAALGGMLVPAFIYFLFNRNEASANGWGIPMATDIAFALGLLSLAGKNIPNAVKVFLAALAVADDLGAVLVIAFFYTAQIAVLPLIVGFACLLVLGAGNLLGIRSIIFYSIVGIMVWACFLYSGVHATIAGVLVACMIPARTKINEAVYINNIRKELAAFEKAIPTDAALLTAEQHHTIENIRQLNKDAATPLQKMETVLHPWVTLFIMPLFALANAGMVIKSNFFTALINPVSLGIAAGLVIGKFAGVLLFTWLTVQLKLAVLPAKANWRHITGVALLAGIGFTMSLFITELAFKDAAMVEQAKYGILIASIIAGTSGLWLLRKVTP
jgi:NhaA family Na+:H+ antiporter